MGARIYGGVLMRPDVTVTEATFDYKAPCPVCGEPIRAGDRVIQQVEHTIHAACLGQAPAAQVAVRLTRTAPARPFPLSADTAAAVLAAIVRYKVAHGGLTPPQRYLAEAAGLRPAEIRPYLKWLETQGRVALVGRRRICGVKVVGERYLPPPGWEETGCA